MKLNTHLYLVLRFSFTLTFSGHMYNIRLCLAVGYGDKLVRAVQS